MKSQSFHFGASHRSSDSIDFSDVFGGPPRRFSPREARARRNVYEIEDSEEERSSMPTRCLKESPVFGELSNSKRHHLGENFFNDIYRGDESFSSPRSYLDGDGGSSRFMSPARIFTPKPESLSSSFPRKFSFPAKLDGANEVPGSSNRWVDGGTSGISSPSSSSRFQGRGFQGYEDDRPLFHQEPLSHESSLRYRTLQCSPTPDRRGNSGRMRNDARIAGDDIDFHFSFYKWGGNGVPVLTLLPLLDGKSLKSRKGDVAVGGHEFFRTGSERKSLWTQRQASKDLEDFFREALDEVCDMKMWEDKNSKNESMPTTAEGKKGLVETFSQSIDVADVMRESQDSRSEAVYSDVSRNMAFTNALKEKWGVDSHYDPDRKPDDSLKVRNPKVRQEEKHFVASSSEMPQSVSVASPERGIDTFEVDFLVEVLSDDPENFAPPEKAENTKDIDAKIRQWSSGKTGNIQSLLSTLQFVLWPGSNWKPVPLSNLIEAGSVKKAYQKAMLQLHPDKLQQKNAASNEKYLAEKVFEILQEAWDHFNTLSHV